MMPHPKSGKSSKSSRGKHHKSKTTPSPSMSKPQISKSKNLKMKPVFAMPFPQSASLPLHVSMAAQPVQLLGTAHLLVPRKNIYTTQSPVDLQPSSDWPSLSRYCQTIASRKQSGRGSSRTPTDYTTGHSVTSNRKPEHQKCTQHVKQSSQTQLSVNRETQQQKRLHREEALAQQTIQEAEDMRKTQKMRAEDFVTQQVELHRRHLQEEARKSSQKGVVQKSGSSKAGSEEMSRQEQDIKSHTRELMLAKKILKDAVAHAKPAREQDIAFREALPVQEERRRPDGQNCSKKLEKEKCQSSAGHEAYMRQAQNLVGSVTVSTTTTTTTKTKMMMR